jgi:hypothetical protein
MWQTLPPPHEAKSYDLELHSGHRVNNLCRYKFLKSICGCHFKFYDLF